MEQNQELWGTYPGYEKHSISSKGRVKIEKSIFTHLIGKTKNIQYNHTTGYCHVKISGVAGKKSFAVHRLVAELFVRKPEVPEGVRLEVDHINRDKTDNRAENLRWVTREQQMENTDYEHYKRPVRAHYPDGTTEDFESINKAAKDLTNQFSTRFFSAGISNVLCQKTSHYKGISFLYLTPGTRIVKEDQQRIDRPFNYTPEPFKRPIEAEYQNGNIEFFSSIKEAAAQLTVTQNKKYSPEGISNVLRGAVKKYKGIKFRYTVDKEFLKFLRSGLSLKDYLEINPGKDLNSHT